MNELEKAFDGGYRKYLSPKYLRISQATIPFFALKGNIRFTPKQMPDRILTSFRNNFCFELKQTQSDSLPLTNIKPHQIAFLTEFQAKSGSAFFIFGFLASSKVFLFPIEIFCKVIRTQDQALIFSLTGKKSISCHDLITLQLRELPMEQLKTHWRLDLSFFLEEDSLSSLE